MQQPAPASPTHNLEILADDRYQRRSTLITSQLPVGKWHEYLDDPTLAYAILDRVIHKAHKIELSGDSLCGWKKNRLYCRTGHDKVRS